MKKYFLGKGELDEVSVSKGVKMRVLLDECT